MRFAAVLLLLTMPALAAETVPPKPAPPPPAAQKPGPPKPGAPKPVPPKAVAPKPGPTRVAPAKPGAAKPNAAKAGKPAVAHPAAPAVVPVPAVVEPVPAEPPKSSSGLKLPRFAALRSDDVNFRSGPGTRYPIEWVYKRRDLPVEIEREFEIWRLVRDPEGSRGWVHQATLTGRRTAVVTGGEQVLRQAANATAPAAARLKLGVIVRLLACEAGSEWCSAQVGDYRGWIKRTEIWGLLPDEVIK